MKLQQMVQQRQDLNCDILSELKNAVVEIKMTAEDMIECATNIKGQGYSMFIRSRENFLDKIDMLQQQLETCLSINSCTH